MSHFLFTLVAIFIAVCAVVIGANNSHTVTFDYFIHSTSLSLSLLMSFCFAAGAVISSVIWGLFSLRLKLKLANIEGQRKKLVKEIVK